MCELLIFLCAFVAYIVLYLDYKKEDRSQKERVDAEVTKQETIYHKTSLFSSQGLTQKECDNFVSFTDRFTTYEQVGQALREAGLKTASAGIILGVDFTASNEWQGRVSFVKKSLHMLNGSNRLFNPYQKVIGIIGGTMANFDRDRLIPAFGFGSRETKDMGVFSFKENGSPCLGFEEVSQRYNEIARKVELSGPTSFAPIIKKAVEIVQQEKYYHILMIITDGQLKREQDTIDAIVEASNHPLSIVVIGVGDGPWTQMHNYDDRLPKRKFDNFQFVDFHRVTAKAKYAEPSFALNALMEIPDQYKTIQELGYLGQFAMAHKQLMQKSTSV